MSKFFEGRIARNFKYFLLILYGFISLYPLIWLLFYSLKSSNEIFFTNPFGLPQKWLFENYVRAWNSFNMPLYLKNSVIVTFSSLAVSIFIALLFSYATARMKWKLSSIARIYISVGLFIPTQVILIPLIMTLKTLHLTSSLLTVILPYIAFNQGFATTGLYAFFRTIPFEYEEAAYIDGAGIFYTFWKIILPMVIPAITSVGIFIGIGNWNEFTVALIMINKEKFKTLPLGLLSFMGQFKTDWGAMGASLVIASIPTIVLYLIFSRQFERALTTGSGLKG